MLTITIMLCSRAFSQIPRSQYDVIKFKEDLLELWPYEVSFDYETRTIPKRKVTARFAYYNKGYYYLYDGNDCYILQTSTVTRWFGDMIQHNMDTMPVIERSVHYRFLEENLEYIPEKVLVKIPYRGMRNYYNGIASRGLDEDVIDFGTPLKEGIEIFIDSVNNRFIYGYILKKNGKKKEVEYYAPFTNLLEVGRQKFRQSIKRELRQFSNDIEYDSLFKRRGYGQIVKKLSIDLNENYFHSWSYTYLLTSRYYPTNGLTVLSNHPFEHKEIYPVFPEYITSKPSVTSGEEYNYQGILRRRNHSLFIYDNPLHKEFVVNGEGERLNDSTYTFNFKIRNGWTEAFRVHLHETEKHLFLKLPGGGEISELEVKGNFQRSGNRLYVHIPRSLDTLQLSFQFTQSLTKEPKQVVPEPEEITTEKVMTFQNVLFKQAESIFADEGQAHEEIDKVVSILNNHPGWSIELRGHTDRIQKENEKVNQELSEGRVKTIKDYLMEKGIDRSRISGKGYGSSQLIIEDEEDPNYALNRRVEFVFHEYK